VVIWQGFGILAGVIPIGLGILAAFAADKLGGPGTIETHGRLIYGCCLLISAGLLHLLSERLSRRPKRVLVDKETGQDVILEEHHAMWFVPLRAWAFLYGVGGAVLILIAVVGGG
jgi:hypothetical protein